METDGDQFHVYRRKFPPNSSNSALTLGSRSSNPINTMAGEGQQQGRREQEHYMPMAHLTRVMRRVLPAHAQISDQAKESIQECVCEFISFITSEANDRSHHELRKTITGEDIIAAMGKLGFDDYIEPLTLYLHRYRQAENERDGRLPLGGAMDYGSLGATLSYGPPLPPPPPQTLNMGNQEGLQDAAAIVTHNYFEEEAGGAGGSTSSRYPREDK
ncbi:hypothetical protein VitviT2T_030011 [Vitis vinifera]|uniref:Transcription factor CBF/NF-Y/archaeal histone domain-containing protein n=2 Tax=Vitis vinifera TaxID=29760 RepID=A0ABY9E2B8_VITVI|eukprot:XP_002268482.1 PREDICTED: nuclear transcription factor Y subunit beta [Vitis vinifera]